MIDLGLKSFYFVWLVCIAYLKFEKLKEWKNPQPIFIFRRILNQVQISWCMKINLYEKLIMDDFHWLVKIVSSFKNRLMNLWNFVWYILVGITVESGVIFGESLNKRLAVEKEKGRG